MLFCSSEISVYRYIQVLFDYINTQSPSLGGVENGKYPLLLTSAHNLFNFTFYQT